MDPVLYDSFDRLLANISTPAVIRDIESGAVSEPLWQQLVASGFADAMIAEDAGGAGLGLGDAFSLWFLCGRHALPLPLAQTMLARALCVKNGIDMPEGSIAIAPMPVTHGDNALDCRAVPFGKLAQWVLVSHADPSGGDVNLLLPASKADRGDTGVHGSLQAHLRWHNATADGLVVPGTFPWLEAAALITAAQMAGAMDSVLNITVKYAAEREQFGRPIGKFQAVQQQLSVLAELASATRMAAELGCGERSSLVPHALAAAVAKARASEAAETVVKIAHAVHAAMGITAEYDLQIFTRRLIEWRIDYGSARYWNRRVGDAVLATDAPSTLEFMLPEFFSETESS